MFLATVLLYPCALALLCLGAGLLVDRLSGRVLPAAVLVCVGAAALIALSQLLTFIPALAPATPYAMAAAAVLGLGLARVRLRELAQRVRAQPLVAAAPVLAYALALAPVLLAGRTSFSSFMALSDSAVHIMGADYLIEHGQSYAHLDLRNSYGQFINAYYNTSYPSGADTLFGGSAGLLGLPLIWAFQPFNAFILASAFGPAWLLARRLGLAGPWAVLAGICAVLPAVVYAYQLLGSVKEVTALSMLLGSGCLVIARPARMLHARTGLVPLALVLAAGVSALGVAFGVWVLVAAAVLLGVLARELAARRITLIGAGQRLGAAVLAGLLAALPTLTNLSGSLHVAQAIASTSNSGNLHSPLRAIQLFGVWLGESYKLTPTGASLGATRALIGLALVAALAGVVQVLRIRALALAGWLALTLLAWLIVRESVTTWASAKTLMLTSPVVVLLGWGGVAALAQLPGARWAGRVAAGVVALALAGGVLLSDALQYRSSNLAPTARYQELASLDRPFAGKGPTLFSDFDEYALYELRNLDVGGPDFVYPPAALVAAAGGYGRPVDLDRVAPAALVSYPLIVTRRDPAAPRPPAVYRLAWLGSYYEVWRRAPGVAPALAHIALAGSLAAQCARIGKAVRSAGPSAHGLIAAVAPELVRVSLARSRHPRRWGRQHGALVMSRPGRLTAEFTLPAGGSWRLWVQGQFMPAVQLSVDGRPLRSIAGELSGNSVVPDTLPPLSLSLAAGPHRVSLTRSAFGLGPGDRGAAVLDAILLTPASTPAQGTLRTAAAASWRTLCGVRYQWLELLAQGS